MTGLKCFCCPSEEAEQREEYGEDGPFCSECHEVWVDENAPSKEHEDVPYDVEVSLQRLSSAVDTMVERWCHRGWSMSVVSDKIADRLRDIIRDLE